MNLSKRKSRLISLISIILAILLVCSFAISMIGNDKVGESAVITTSSADFINTDMLFSNRQGTTVGSKVFDGDLLDQLYAKLAGNNATFADVANKARTQKDTYSNTNVRSIHSGMDSADIRTANNNKNIVVTLGGKQWIVTALTTKDNSGTSDVILTLMLKDVAYKSRWGGLGAIRQC